MTLLELYTVLALPLSALLAWTVALYSKPQTERRDMRRFTGCTAWFMVNAALLALVA
jgi:hypothetical protein